MKITIESTTKIVEFVTPDGGHLPVRVWEGATEGGVKVHCFIPRIGAKDNQDLSQFERELQEQAVPSFEIAAFPLRFIL